jgi:hypothetical protein
VPPRRPPRRSGRRTDCRSASPWDFDAGTSDRGPWRLRAPAAGSEAFAAAHRR